ncbi:unnamed protein product [Rhizoctonia solani]|uniref:F-box domain-containing protein n=1 Tax=Rhizoctonia solani TaxID=456999 RepID=A0A8H2XM43_9AGAM|nr:unnamed protein product [Rhizoctonia solani]
MHTTVQNLPLELLAYIFHLVRDSQPCAKRDYSPGSTETRQVYPAALSQVCSRWRSIAFSTSALWSHIDISTSIPLNQLHLDAIIDLHLTHARQTPLELHVFDPMGYPVSSSHINKPLHELIMRLASRTYSFNFDADRRYGPDTHHAILGTFFKGCVPGRLTRLMMRHDHDDWNSGFIKAKDDLDNDGRDLDLPTEQLESILAGVSILHVTRWFPQWTSRAYHGLTELRLNGLFTRIKESDLVDILRSSPGLRIFELGLDTDNILPMGVPVTTVPLNNLEAVNVSLVLCEELAALFRWFAPGSKPLQIAIRQGEHEYLRLKKQLGPFFSRSCVNRVYGRGLNFSHLVGLLELLPHLQELVVSWMRLNPSFLNREEIIRRTLDRRLERLYITQSSIHIEDVLALISIPGCLVNTIILNQCMLCRDGFDVPQDQEGVLLEGLKQEHPEINLIIQYTEEPSPVESWDVFASYADSES